jgi:hypothetical protein
MWWALAECAGATELKPRHDLIPGEVLDALVRYIAIFTMKF